MLLLVGQPGSLPNHTLLGAIAFGVVGEFDTSGLQVSIPLRRPSGSIDSLRILSGRRGHPVQLGSSLEMRLASNATNNTVYHRPVFLVF